MSPEIYFALTLVVRMAVTAAFLIVTTVTAERAGPVIGGLVAALPVSTGPVYIFLSLDHNAQFIADSAIGTLVTNGINVVYALIYALLAQKRPLWASLGAAVAGWIVIAWIANSIAWTLSSAILWNVVAIGGSILIVRQLRHYRVPAVRSRWYDFALRAGLVALLVGTVVTLSFHIGPKASGLIAGYPIVFSSIMLVMHRSMGGRAAAAVMANAILGLTGFALGAITLHLAAVPLGSGPALLLGLAACLAWSGLMYAARLRGMPI
jgi:hypothetical protein